MNTRERARRIQSEVPRQSPVESGRITINKKQDRRKYNEAALHAYLAQGRIEVDHALDQFLSKKQAEKNRLYEAMRYSLMAGGKRFRPLLCIAAAESVGGKREIVLPFACAIELIHTYSLVHDDLPAMDNDHLRRGVPTNHIVYGEGVAILVGDALLTAAFTEMCQNNQTARMDPKNVLAIIFELGSAAGMNGMVLGQWIDLQSAGKDTIDASQMEAIHKNKTGALITASVRIGGLLGQAKVNQLRSLTEYGQKVGLAFQIMDDLLDILGKEEALGKSVGQDHLKEKWTYPRLVGLRKARQEANRLATSALAALNSFGPEADPLRWIAHYTVNRKS